MVNLFEAQKYMCKQEQLWYIQYIIIGYYYVVWYKDSWFQFY